MGPSAATGPVIFLDKFENKICMDGNLETFIPYLEIFIRLAATASDEPHPHSGGDDHVTRSLDDVG